MLSRSLNWLVLVCGEGSSGCAIGRYIVSRLVYRVYRDAFDEYTVVMVGLTARKRGYVLSFSVSKLGVDPPRKPISFDVDRCVPGVCIDGINIPPNSYRQYVFDRYALIYRDLGDRYVGNLFYVGSIDFPGRVERWRMRRRLKKLVKM